MDQIIWILLSYQVPVEPSKKRVYVWRKIKEMGAIYYRQGVAMLPKNPVSLIQFKKLADKVLEMGGEASLAELKFLSKKDDQLAVAQFVKQSRGEYKKLILEIAQLYNQKPSTKEEAEQIAEKGKKLERRLNQTKARDYFMSRRDPEVMVSMNRLLKDMSSATDNLTKHLYNLMEEQR